MLKNTCGQLKRNMLKQHNLIDIMKEKGKGCVMEEVRVSSFMEYMQYVSAQCGEKHLFRGVHNGTYRLVPKIGRSSYGSNFAGETEEAISQLQDLEESTMRRFVMMSVPYLDMRNMNTWDQWTIGQHHGVPTRFLDWTENPLIAAYFAVEKYGDMDAAVYIINRDSFSVSGDVDDVFSARDEIVLHIPSYINPRIIAQKGVFTVHKNPRKPIDKVLEEMEAPVTKIVIDHACFLDFRRMLDWCGINRSFVYPGLDGVAGYLDALVCQSR